MILAAAVSLLAAVAAGCEEAGRSTSSSVETPRFSEVTSEAGLAGFRHVNGAFGEKWFPETMGSGGAFLDYDGDGHLDILLVGGGTWPQRGDSVPAVRLYGNDGDGTFTERTEAAGLKGLRAYGMGVSVADYDEDGDDDVFITTLERDLLLRNAGGAFEEVGARAGVAGPASWSTASIFFDPDRDGDLDLYVGGYVQWSPETDVFCSLDGERKSYCTPHVYEGLPARYYENDGAGRFRERSDEIGILGEPQKTLGVAQLDYDRDGWPDLVVANDMEPDLLYRNRGDGTFSEEGLLSGIALGGHGRAFNGMGVDTGIVDTTGEVSIFVGNFSNQPIGVFRHDRDGLFEDRSAASGIGPASLTTLTFGLVMLDADLDGDLDVFAANGHVQPDVDRMEGGAAHRQPSHLFINAGDGTFVDAAPDLAASLGRPIVGRGAASGDYDGDGDADLLVTENNGPAYIFRNEASERRYLRITLEGRRSNRDGIGARIEAFAAGARQVRTVRSGSSYLSASEKTVTFGLGRCGDLDSVLIEWPSGTTDRLRDLHADRHLVVVEGSTLEVRPARGENSTEGIRRRASPQEGRAAMDTGRTVEAFTAGSGSGAGVSERGSGARRKVP